MYEDTLRAATESRSFTARRTRVQLHTLVSHSPGDSEWLAMSQCIIMRIRVKPISRGCWRPQGRNSNMEKPKAVFQPLRCPVTQVVRTSWSFVCPYGSFSGMDFCQWHVGLDTKAGWQCKLVSLLSNQRIYSGAETGVILHFLVTTVKEYKDQDEIPFDEVAFLEVVLSTRHQYQVTWRNQEFSPARSRCSLAFHPCSYSTNTWARL